MVQCCQVMKDQNPEMLTLFVIIQIIHENSIHIIIIPHKLTNMDKINNNISVYEA